MSQAPGSQPPSGFSFFQQQEPPHSTPRTANGVHVAADGESIKTIFFFSTPVEKPGPCSSQNHIQVEQPRDKGHTSPSSPSLVMWGRKSVQDDTATDAGPQVFHAKGQERCCCSEHLEQGAHTLPNPLYLCTLPLSCPFPAL